MNSFFVRWILLGMVTTVAHSFAQECGTPGYFDNQSGSEPVEQFEKWMKEELERQNAIPANFRKKSVHYKIPVVVHVIHNGEAIGTGVNIPDDQIFSQIAVLNKDFNRLNADASATPAEFLPFAAAMTVEFVLAQSNPSGLPTSGINRVQGTKGSWTRDDDTELKSLSYWPAENYLNIWVCNLLNFRGYTQFPVSTLPGIDNSPRNRLTDGIVIGYRFFGSSDYGSFGLNASFDKGRTTTHEVGHFLGLRHIWGDKDDCSGTDYVNDTPPQAGSTNGCPTHPVKQCPAENPVAKMFQNYMDLSEDRCMNLFTREQVGRMLVVLENSPRRASLLLALDPDPPEYEFERIFTPNGDGVNDFWRWTNTLKYEGCELRIFNRSGIQVFEMKSYDNSWDGRSSSGNILEAGPYYFTVRCDGKGEIRGGVRIIR